MKKETLVRFVSLTIILLLIFFLSSCAEEGPSVPNTPGNELSGVYILYEGSNVNTDYALYNPISGNLTNDVFHNSNPGQSLGVVPGDMRIYSHNDLYITCRGTSNFQGGVYKINAGTNKLVSSLELSANPQGLVVNNNNLLIANIGSNYVSRLDISLNIVRDSIITGSMPSNILYGFNQYIVCKAAPSGDQKLAVINESTNNVTMIQYDFVPVSATYNFYGYFISGHTKKTIYRIDPENFVKLDSIYLPTGYGFIGDIIRKDATSFFVIAGNREAWQVDVAGNGELSASIKVAETNGITIAGAAYEETKNELYIADNNDGLANGELHIFSASNGQIKSTIPLGGRNPSKIAFRY